MLFCVHIVCVCMLDPASIVLLLIVCSCAAMISASVLSFNLAFPAIGRITSSLTSLILLLVHPLDDGLGVDPSMHCEELCLYVSGFYLYLWPFYYTIVVTGRA